MTEDAHCLAIKAKCISIDFRMLRASLYPNSTARVQQHKYTSCDKKCHTATGERVGGFPTGVGYACMDAICFKFGRDDHEAEPLTIKNIGACECNAMWQLPMK